MKTVKLNTNINRRYANNGQHAEQVARFTLTGEIVKADNKPFTAGADVLDIQIKSARATVCDGLDIRTHVALDVAKCYGYVTADFTKMYIMSPDEWVEFVEKFGTATTDSPKNGGRIKLRLSHESKAMRHWRERASGVNR